MRIKFLLHSACVDKVPVDKVPEWFNFNQLRLWIIELYRTLVKI